MIYPWEEGDEVVESPGNQLYPWEQYDPVATLPDPELLPQLQLTPPANFGSVDHATESAFLNARLNYHHASPEDPRYRDKLVEFQVQERIYDIAKENAAKVQRRYEESGLSPEQFQAVLDYEAHQQNVNSSPLLRVGSAFMDNPVAQGVRSGGMDLYQGLEGAAARGAGLVADIFGAEETARELDKIADENSRAKAQRAIEDRHAYEQYGGTVGRIAGDVSNTLTQLALLQGAPIAKGAWSGLAKIAGYFGIDTANQTFTEARDAGLPDTDARNLALLTGGIEAGTTLLFGGAERALGVRSLENIFGPQTKTAISSSLRRILGGTLSEITEEETILFADTYARHLYGMSEGATPSKEDVVYTAAVSAVATGVMHGAEGAAAFTKTPSRRTARNMGLPDEYINGEGAKKKRDALAADVTQAIETKTVSVNEEEISTEPEAPPQELSTEPTPEPTPESALTTEPETEGKPVDSRSSLGDVAAAVGEAAGSLLPYSLNDQSTLGISLDNDIGKQFSAKGKRALRWVKENLLSTGNRNEETERLLADREGFIARNLLELRQNLNDVRRATRKAKLPKSRETAQLLNDALTGEQVELPLEVQLEVRKMRDHIDSLSRLAASLPDVDGELQLTIEENLGSYVTRSYKKFDNPQQWKEKALHDPDIMEGFAEAVRQQKPGATDESIEKLATYLLNRNTASLGDVEIFSPRRNRYVRVLKKRKELSEAIRNLYGENKDAAVNYQKSVSVLAHLVAHKQFVQDLRQTGLESGFLFESVEDAPAGLDLREINDQLPQLKPLQGLVGDDDVLRTIEDLYTVHQRGGMSGAIYSAAVGLSALSKSMKTVHSFKATIRNYFSNPLIAMSNGVFSLRGFSQSARDTWFTHLLDRPNSESRARVKRYAELGLLEDVSQAELRSMAKELSANLGDYLEGDGEGNWLKKYTRFRSRTYQSMDVFWKIYTFESYRPQYRQAFPEMIDEEVDRHTADVVSNLVPTYSRASKAAKYWSRVLPLGPFAMFSFEMLRTTGNRFRLSAQEIASGNPHLQRMGAKRVAGTVAAFGMAEALEMLSQSLVGVSDEEEEAIRQRIAPWQRNSPLFFVKQEDGSVEHFDLGYNSPFGIFSKPAKALMRGEPVEAAIEFSSPFTGEDLAYGAILGIFFNQDGNGRPVYDEGLTADQQLSQIWKFFRSRFTPGDIDNLERIGKGYRGEISSGGKEYDLTNEILSTLGGFRLEKLDVEQADEWRNRAFSSSMARSESSIRNNFGNRGTVDLEELAELYRSAEAKRRQTHDQWHQFMQGSAVLGNEHVYASAVKHLGTSSNRLKRAYVGAYQPYLPSDVTLRKWSRLPQGQERVELFRKLYAETLVESTEE